MKTFLVVVIFGCGWLLGNGPAVADELAVTVSKKKVRPASAPDAEFVELLNKRITCQFDNKLSSSTLDFQTGGVSYRMEIVPYTLNGPGGEEKAVRVQVFAKNGGVFQRGESGLVADGAGLSPTLSRMSFNDYNDGDAWIFIVHIERK
jgi:hypothetical protein